ncbi:MAG: glycosyltransferase family 4 protein [Actinomycetes bacterium]
MRILHLSWEYPPQVYGGLGRHVHGLARAQAAAGHEVTVMTSAVDGADHDEVAAGVRVVRVPADPPLVPPEDLLATVLADGHAWVRAGRRAADEREPEILHAHDWMTCHAATALKEAMRLPLVATVHATEAGRHQGWLPTGLSRAIHTTEWWLTYEARRVLTCSESMRDEVVRLFELPVDKVDVVPNGVDVAQWTVPPARAAAARRTYLGDAATGRSGPAPLLVYAGRLEWEKGVHTLLDALPRLRRRFPGARLVLAGRGTYEPELRERVRRLRLGGAVTFAGFLPEPELAALLAGSDAVVVPSLYEPFGIVALEAAAARAPLVVADTGGLREIVEPGVSGATFTAGDVTGLVDAVAELLTDQVLAQRTVRAAHRRVARDLRWPSVAERVVQTYQRAVQEERALQAGLAGRLERPLRVVVRDGNLLAEAP